ncbi:MAG TPA: GAF domain-containing protein, partial [Anaerolineales bacterium]|nr:GAF domain-containing protein [Anaerolineales bacterium]
MNPSITQLDPAIELQKRLEQQAFIADLAQKALASQNVQYFLDEAARRVAEVLNADCCEILQYEPDSQSFFFRSGHGWQDIYPGKARFNVETDTQFDLMTSLSGPILVSDFENEDRFSGPIWLREHECRSGIIVLIKRNAEPIGVLGVYSRQPDYFSETDFDFLNSIASIIGAHFKNHQIVNEYKLLAEDLEKRVAQRAALVQLIHEVTSAANLAGSVQDAIRIVLKKVCDYTGWPVGHAYLPDDKEPRELVDTPLWHLAEPEQYDGVRAATQQARYPLGLGLPGRVFVSHLPAWRTDLADSESPWREAAAQAGLQSVFALPVLVQDDPVAVLEFFSLSNERPEKDLMAALSNLGLQLGRVVERRRAEEKILESQQRLAEAQRIAKLGSWERDLRKDKAYWSDELYELYGVSPGAFDGSFNTFLNLVHPDDKPEFVRSIETTFQNPGPFQLNFRILRPDGRERAMIAVGNIFAD